jgi:hypothetical protein
MGEGSVMDHLHLGVIIDLTGAFTRADRSLAGLDLDGTPLDVIALFTCRPDLLESVMTRSSHSNNDEGPRASVFVLDEVDLVAIAEAILAHGPDLTDVSLLRTPLGQALAVEICRLDPSFELVLGVWQVDRDSVSYVVSDHALSVRARPARTVLIWEPAAIPISDRYWPPEIATSQVLPARDDTIARASSSGSQSLSHARLVVDIGAGAALEAHDIELAERFAQRIGASLGCTRVVSDRGLLAEANQIGTTGVTAAPEVLIAFGVSGAIQHLGALDIPSQSISVNLDVGAPMQQAVEHPITADARAVLEILGTEAPVMEASNS